MPITNAQLDVVLVLIDASFVGFWTLLGLALLGAGPELLADAFRWWRGR